VTRVRDDGSEEAFQNPIYQVKRQRSHLTDWLSRNRVPNLPIHSLVVMSNPRTIIKSLPSHKDIPQYITHSPYLQERIQVFNKMHSDEKLTKKEITKLSKMLVRQHTPDNPDLLKRYQIEEKDIIKGVYCTKCFYMPVVRKYGTWYCSKCSLKSMNLHLPTLEDYALLYGTSISNKEACDFLQISSRHVATRIFSSMNLPYTGSGKGRRYQLQLPI
jgi:hypothetical protein